jgi:hypothetical protein
LSKAYTKFKLEEDKFEKENFVKVRLISNADFPYDFKNRQMLKVREIHGDNELPVQSSGWFCIS